MQIPMHHPHVIWPACCVTRGRPFPLLLPSAWGAHTTACAREQRDRIPTHTNLLGNRIQSIGTALVQIPMCTPHALWTCGGVHAPVRAPPTRRAHAPARWPAPQHAGARRGTSECARPAVGTPNLQCARPDTLESARWNQYQHSPPLRTPAPLRTSILGSAGFVRKTFS